jgi:hypothetical protein
MSKHIKALLFAGIVATPLKSEILIQGEIFDIGKPEITSEINAKSFRTKVDGEVAFIREIRDDKRNYQLVFINEKQIAVVKTVSVEGKFEHNINFSVSDHLIQVVVGRRKNYVIIRANDTGAILRVVSMDSKREHVEVLK